MSDDVVMLLLVGLLALPSAARAADGDGTEGIRVSDAIAEALASHPTLRLEVAGAYHVRCAGILRAAADRNVQVKLRCREAS